MTAWHRSLFVPTVPLLLCALAACSQEPAKPAATTPAPAEAAPPPAPPKVRVYVTNETSGDLTIINGDTQAVMATATSIDVAAWAFMFVPVEVSHAPGCRASEGEPQRQLDAS